MGAMLKAATRRAGEIVGDPLLTPRGGFVPDGEFRFRPASPGAKEWSVHGLGSEQAQRLRHPECIPPETAEARERDR